MPVTTFVIILDLIGFVILGKDGWVGNRFFIDSDLILS